MTTKLILPNHYNWKGGGENIKQKYECFKTAFYPGFIILYNLVLIRRRFQHGCKDGCKDIQLK